MQRRPTGSGMTPLFFGDPTRQLFGAYHAGAAGRQRPVGVLLCYPGPQEYMFAHRAFRRLSETLAARGYPVLRFDWAGTGDSSGDLETATLARWRANLVTAAEELSELAGVAQVSVVGMRLGASLAACVAAEARRFRDVVLWDPIVRGPALVDELRAIDRQRYAMSHVRRGEPPADELCGFAFPSQLRRDLDALDLLQLPRLAVRRVAILTSADAPDALAFERHLAAAGNDVSLHVVHDPEALAKRKTLAESLLSRTMVDAVAERIAA